MIRRVPITMATIVHNIIDYGFSYLCKGVTRRNITMTTHSIPFVTFIKYNTYVVFCNVHLLILIIKFIF